MQESVEKVVELVQTDMKAKTFRHDYPVSEELRQVMVGEVFREFMVYALDQYYHDENLLVLMEYVEEHMPRQEKRSNLVHNLFWWHLFYQSNQHSSWNFIEAFISQSYYTLRNRPFITDWLRKCKSAVTKFYFVGPKFTDNTFVAIDILTEQPLDIIVCDPCAIPAKPGEIVMGTLIPLGGGLFFPIIDFYHFDYEAREAIANCIHHHYETHLKTSSSLHEAFLHVLSIMLQIERIISLETHTTNSPN